MQFSDIPILQRQDYGQPSVFLPENLLSESRRQKNLPRKSVPSVCVLDPDGDMVRFLRKNNLSQRDPAWACYHTDLYTFISGELEIGIVGCAVGGSFAVLVAEELFACGCEFLISITSAGQIVSRRLPPYFILIEQALRDEGTSFHYLPPSRFVSAPGQVLRALEPSLKGFSVSLERGKAWTTDAPFRETEAAICSRGKEGILAVEMESASLYAFAQARGKPVVCFAHVTNQMGVVKGDFEKGLEDGSRESLNLAGQVAKAWVTHLKSGKVKA